MYSAAFILIFNSREKREGPILVTKKQAISLSHWATLAHPLPLTHKGYVITINGQTIHMKWNRYYKLDQNVHIIESKVWVHVFTKSADDSVHN